MVEHWFVAPIVWVRFPLSTRFYINKLIVIMIFHLIIPFFLFIVGIFGIFLSRKNIILVIMSLELLLLSINYYLIFFSYFLDDLLGQVFSLLILSVAASESAIGLAIIISYYKLYSL